MKKNKIQIIKDGLVLGASVGCLWWGIWLFTSMLHKEWNISVMGGLCGLFFLGLACVTGWMAACRLWSAFDEKYTDYLKEKYQKKYMSHKDDELYLRKEYDDVATWESFLAPFYLEKYYTIRAIILYDLFELIEKEREQELKEMAQRKENDELKTIYDGKQEKEYPCSPDTGREGQN